MTYRDVQIKYDELLSSRLPVLGSHLETTVGQKGNNGSSADVSRYRPAMDR